MRWAPSRADIEDTTAELTEAPSLFALRVLRMEHQVELMADRVQALVLEEAARQDHKVLEEAKEQMRP